MAYQLSAFDFALSLDSKNKRSCAIVSYKQMITLFLKNYSKRKQSKKIKSCQLKKKETIFGAARKIFGPSYFDNRTFASCKVHEKATSCKRLRESNQIIPLVNFENQNLNLKSLFTLGLSLTTLYMLRSRRNIGQILVNAFKSSRVGILCLIFLFLTFYWFKCFFFRTF